MATLFNFKRITKSASFVFALFALLLGNGNQIHAAEILKSTTKYCDVMLDGVIGSGDTEKLIQFAKINKLIDPEGYDIGYALCLNSPGGSLNEA